MALSLFVWFSDWDIADPGMRKMDNISFLSADADLAAYEYAAG